MWVRFSEERTSWKRKVILNYKLLGYLNVPITAKI